MFTNRLAREKSPYLLQHAHNPVDWFAWNDEAFAKARTENKPIFLSIGYSTCHWCHVMERESFEKANVGKFLNEHFVSIKVDREERPDVDKIYMTFVQSTTGSGGWPMSVFLTPELKPFFGGTYFPPDARHGRPSFLQLLEQIAGLWRERRTEIVASADELHARLELITVREAKADLPLTPEILKRALENFKEAYDAANGGFGGAPKFPQPSIPSLVLRAAKRFGDDAARQMVLHTCNRMNAGGIHDQLGGGFARYAVDAEWLVPHFEKMLYDNAQLVHLYLDAHLASHPHLLIRPSATFSPTGEEGREEGATGQQMHPHLATAAETHYSETARDILDYVLRDMTHPEGGFFSAEDADSEGQEGKFYCWTHDELSKLLTVEEYNVAASYFGITSEGNFVDHSHPAPLPGLNVLSITNPLTPSLSPTGGEGGRRPGEGPTDPELLASAKAKMLAVRAQRIRPHLDDKILASWNGLMLGAFARASVVLGEEKYRAAAEKNVRFIREKLWLDSGSPSALTPALSPGEREKRSQLSAETKAVSGSLGSQTKENSQLLSPLPAGEGQGEGERGGVGTLYHRWRDGERDNVQLLEGYAFMLSGIIELYEATLAPAHLDFAIELAGAMLAKFYDPADGGFWQSPAGMNDLILRVKDDYDGAEPSGNSVATLALLKLAAITGREDFKQAAEATLQLCADRLQKQPAALACMLQALDFWLDEPRRVVIADAAEKSTGGYGENGEKTNRDPHQPERKDSGNEIKSDPASVPSGSSCSNSSHKSKLCHELIHAAHSIYQPNKIVLGNTGAVEPFAKTLTAKENAMVYLCTGNSCQPPTDDPTKVKERLR